MKGYIHRPKLADVPGHADVIGFGDDTMKVKTITRNTANRLIEANHYSKTVYRGSWLHLGVFVDGRLMGCLQYGQAMNPASAGSIVKGSDFRKRDCVELNRMWLSDDLGRNSESKAISYSIKYLKRATPVRWIQSFSDGRLGTGIVYQSANFGFYGSHDATFWWSTVDDRFYHHSLMTRDPSLAPAAKRIQQQAERGQVVKHDYPQYRYLYFLDPRAKRDCLLTEQPYPKPETKAA